MNGNINNKLLNSILFPIGVFLQLNRHLREERRVREKKKLHMVYSCFIANTEIYVRNTGCNEMVYEINSAIYSLVLDGNV